MTTHFENQDSSRLSDQLAYDPNNLLDTLIDKLHLKNDAALSRALEVAPPVISKIRHRRLPVGASLLIRMHEVSDLSIRELRTLMGDRRKNSVSVTSNSNLSKLVIEAINADSGSPVKNPSRTA